MFSTNALLPNKRVLCIDTGCIPDAYFPHESKQTYEQRRNDTDLMAGRGFVQEEDPSRKVCAEVHYLHEPPHTKWTSVADVFSAILTPDRRLNVSLDVVINPADLKKRERAREWFKSLWCGQQSVDARPFLMSVMSQSKQVPELLVPMHLLAIFLEEECVCGKIKTAWCVDQARNRTRCLADYLAACAADLPLPNARPWQAWPAWFGYEYRVRELATHQWVSPRGDGTTDEPVVGEALGSYKCMFRNYLVRNVESLEWEEWFPLDELAADTRDKAERTK